jgi:integrase
MSLRKINGRYYYSYRDEHGRPRTIATKETDRAKAEAFANAVMSAVRAKRKTAHFLKHAGPGVISIQQQADADSRREAVAVRPQAHHRGSIALADMFEIASRYRALSDTHRKIWALFVRRIQPIRFADQITARIALGYMTDHYADRAPKTWNNIIGILDVVFRLCLIETGLDASPFHSLMKRRLTETKHYRPLTVDEFRRTFAICNLQWQTLSLIGWHTGARLETCKKIAVMLYRQDAESLTVMPGKTARFGRAVFIPIHKELRAWMAHVRASVSAEEIDAWDIHQINGSDRRSYYVAALRRAGVFDTEDGKASFHSLRNSFITRCDAAGIPRQATRGIVGQVSDDTTDLYSHDKTAALAILSLPSVRSS